MDENNDYTVLFPEKFPKLLREINDPPDNLWVEGELPSEESVHLSVVGTRKFSSYGKEACQKIISGLKGADIVIVSGLALGIDAIAHQAALDANLKTIAIPGSGLNRKVLHPRSNHKLAEEILKRGGALLSEFPPNMPAGIHTFPKRNRIIAGMSKATLVIEAPKRSGTLITARLAGEYNRDVFAVPGSIFSTNSLSSNRLIKQGAVPISSSADLLEALGFKIEDVAVKKAKMIEATDQEKEILNILTEPLVRDELIRKSGLSTNEANSLLMMMEVKELIREVTGEIYSNV